MPSNLRTLFFAFFTTLAQLAMGQETRTIEGQVIDSAGKPIARASVMLWYETPGDTLRTLTGDTGSFAFTGVKSRPFFIRATHTGFNALERKVEDDGIVINLGSLELLPAITTLQEVVVTTPPIQIREDTIEYKADSFKVKPNAMVEDLLKKLPGVSVDKDGNVLAQGKQVTRVKVNGKDFFQGDVKTATRELSADMVDKVQIVDDYGDQATVSGIRDGEPERIMNLQLKKDRNKGAFGRVTAGAGTDQRYQVSGNLNYFNNNKQLSLIGNTNNINANLFDGAGQNFSMGGGRGLAGGIQLMQGGGASSTGGDGITSTHSIGANFRSDFEKSIGSSFYGSYTYTRRLTDVERATSVQNLTPENTFTQNDQSLSYNESGVHRANMNLEYRIDSFNYLKVSPQLSFSESANENRADFNMFNEKGIQTQDGFRKDSSEGYTPNLSVNILYNHRFKRKGRNFSVNTNLSTNENQQDRQSYNFTEYSQASQLSVVDQLRRQDNRASNVNTRLVYTEPIARNRFMDLSYTYRNNFTRNDVRVYNLETGTPVFNNQISNAFENEFIQQRIGANVRTVNKKYNYTLGLVAQPVTLKGYSISKDSSYTPSKRVNFIPVARLAYNFTRTRTLNVNYMGDVQQPTLTQLQPLVDNTNPQNVTTGNPDLKPAVTHGINAFFNNFNFQSGKILFVGINAAFEVDRITYNTTYTPEGNRISRPENIDGYYQLTAFYNWGRPFANRTYVLGVNGNIMYGNDPAFVEGQKSSNRSARAMQGVSLEFNHKEWLEMDFRVNYYLTSQKSTLQPQTNNFTQTWQLSYSGRLDLPEGLIFRYDLTQNIYLGFARGIDPNYTFMTASLEKTVLKKKNGFIRLSAFDLFNQNQGVSRTFTNNTIIDTRVNRLGRYFMLSFTYRLNRFNGQAGSGQGPRMMERRMMRF